MPALDGLRAVAVIAVLLFHARFRWAKGGFLGVTAFFVLSGYLIAGLLLAERDQFGSIDLCRFWARRARRLAPAILVLLTLVLGYTAFGPVRPAPGILGDAVATLTWSSNWRLVLTHSSYAALFSAPSPLQHMWSLAVEEQFYLILPISAALLLGRRGQPKRWRLAAVAVTAITASTLVAAVLHPAGAGPGRAYYGTDARAAEPLVGVLLALLLVGPGGRRTLQRAGRAAIDITGLAASAGLVWMTAAVSERGDGLYRGGFLLAALLTAGVIAAATQPGTVVAWVLSVRPLRALGRVSYGIYLFHWPVFLWVTARRTGLTPIPLFSLRCAITLLIAVASFVLIERPVRRGTIAGRVAAIGWANASVGLTAGLVLLTMSPAVAGEAVTHEPSTNWPAPVVASAPIGEAVGTTTTSPSRGPSRPAAPATTRPLSATRFTSHSSGGGAAVLGAGTTRQAPPPPSAAPGPSGKPPLKVAVVGDSMADGLAGGLDNWANARGGVVIYNLSTPACPFSAGGGTRRLADGSDFAIRSECSWWTDPSSDRSTKLAQFAPDVVVMQDGMNELPDRKLPSWPDYRHTSQPQFDNWLLNQYSDAAKTLTAHGAKLLLLNAVCADWETMGQSFAGYADNSDGDRRVRSLDTTTAGMTTTGVKQGDLQSHLCPNGTFTQSIDGVDNARPDGYHLSKDASTAVATKWLGPLVIQTQGATVL